MKNSETIVQFNCPLLSKTVKIVLTYLHHNDDFKIISQIDCKSDKQCAICHPDGHGGFTWERDKCPAMNYFQSKNK